VGADGGRSFVRGVLGVDFPGKTLGMQAMVADTALTGLDREVWHQFNGGDMKRMIAICPLAGTDLFQIQAPIPLDVEVDLSAEGIERMLAERTGRGEVKVRSVNWASAYSMNARLADRYRIGRVFLAGDAAHIHPPTGGQGLNTSIQDAYNLGWKLAAALGGAPDRLLDTYESERRPVAEAVLGLATGLLDAAKRGGLGRMRRGREVRQLDIGYPRSPLAFDPSARAGVLRAGDRAPDAPLLGASGCARRLFELFAGPHWTLIGFETRCDITARRKGLHIHRIGTDSELADEGGHFQAAYDLSSGEWVLVRPDGYVAAILPPDAAEPLRNFLEEVGLSDVDRRSPN
jgi:hypothetical protein